MHSHVEYEFVVELDGILAEWVQIVSEEKEDVQEIRLETEKQWGLKNGVINTEKNHFKYENETEIEQVKFNADNEL